jgi:hypothetical protein
VFRASRVSVGLLSGSQPDPAGFGYSGETREHGAFVQVLSAPGSDTKVSATAGIIGSYTAGEINHEYLTLQTHYSSGTMSIYGAQDVHFNRGWKREAEGKSLSLNNTYTSLRYQAAQKTTLSAGFDNRRSIRLYRDFISPEVEFDDTFRQGVWTGVNHRIGKFYRVGAKVKSSTGGSSGSANTYTLNGAIQWAVNVHGRTTHFDNDLLSGWIHSGSAGFQLGPQMRVELGAGVRTQKSETAVGSDDRLTWTSIMVD